VTLENGTAAMEEQQLLTNGWQQPQILWEHNAWLLREQFFGVNHMYICRPYVGQNWKQAGARQIFPL
jgi:hypothetical protein